MTLPSRYWEPTPDEMTEEELLELQEEVENDGIIYDAELPFN